MHDHRSCARLSRARVTDNIAAAAGAGAAAAAAAMGRTALPLLNARYPICPISPAAGLLTAIGMTALLSLLRAESEANISGQTAPASSQKACT